MGSPMKPLSILVVDDHEPTQRVLQLWLEAHGHRVVCASCGNEAYKLLSAQRVDLVITDVLMPDGNGIDLIAKLKKTQPALCILAISGGGPHVTSSSCLQRAHGVGANALLLKPFKQDQLLSAMRYVLGAGDVSEALETARNPVQRQRTIGTVKVFPGVGAEPTPPEPAIRSRETP